jgi:HAMP domain-containing protein/HPt (histidine-containing phosphotransfer) domain-containing protein
MRRIRLSLEPRLAIVASIVLVLMSITLFVELASRERAKLIAAKTEAASMLTQLLANELTAAIDFDDMDDVRTSLNFLHSNPDIVGTTVWSIDGLDEPVAGWVAPGAPSVIGPQPTEPDGVTTTPQWLVATRAIVGQHGKPLARVRVVFTLRSENDAFRSNRRQLFWMTGGLTAVAALLFGLLARRYVVGPIKHLATAATALAHGDSGARVDARADNEIGDLARAFNLMSEAVAFREAKLRARNDDMKLVLDHMAQGLFTIDCQGTISSEYSHALAEWLGPPIAGDTLWSYFGRFDPRLALPSRLAWEAVVEDVLPRELTLDQMPKNIHAGDRHLRLGYLPITVNGTLSKVLVVVSDVTSDIARERADEAQRDTLRVFEQFTKDRNGFAEFFTEADALVRRIIEIRDASPEPKRLVHTLKGNCAQFGLAGMATLCHRLEASLLEAGGVLPDTEREELERTWSQTRTTLSFFMGDAGGDRFEIEEGEYQRLLADLDAGISQRRIARELRRWRLEPTARRLDRVARQATALAARIGKGHINVVVEPNGLRLDGRAWAPFWSAFVHVIRNAVDHGIETKDERVAAGKQGTGTLTVRTYVTGGEFVVEAADDGKGIDWAALAARCRALGHPCANKQEIEQVLFASGLSTKAEVTEHSGRGIGMGAIGAACVALGGRPLLHSAGVAGTVLQFRFPVAAMGEGGGLSVVTASDAGPEEAALAGG